MVAPDASDKFLSRNRMAGLTAILVFPLSEIAALTNFLPLVMPPGQVLAISLAAAIAIWQGRAAPGRALPGRALPGRAVLGGAVWPACAWLAVSGGLILYLAVSRAGWAATLNQFAPMFAVLGAFMVLSRLLTRHGRAWRKALSCILCASCLFVGAIIAWSILDAAVIFLPLVYDPVLYRIDAMLGLGAAYRLGDLLNANQAFRHFILILYKYNLVFAIPALFSEVFYARKAAAELTLQLLVSSFLVFPLFCMMPALAPAFFFGGLFPDHLPPAQSLATQVIGTNIGTIRNTFPSLHACWALLIFLALRDSPLWHRSLGALFVLVTVIATLGFGEHYAVDWVAALPLVLLVRGVCCASLPLASPLRQCCVMTGILLLALWVVAVRGAPVTLAFPWAIRALAIVSVALPLAIENTLAVAERQHVRLSRHAVAARAE